MNNDMKSICKAILLLILFVIDVLKFGLAVIGVVLKTVLLAVTVITSFFISYADV